MRALYTQCLEKFLAFPTYISSEVVDQSEAEFPALTVCPDPGYRTDRLNALGIKTTGKFLHTRNAPSRFCNF